MKRLLSTVAACCVAVVAVSGQQTGEPRPAMPRKALPSAPFVIETSEQGQVRVTPVRGLANPWSLVFLPNGDILVTERPGRLRLVRDGLVHPTPISGVPMVHAQRLGGLMGLALHPRFAENRLVYLS